MRDRRAGTVRGNDGDRTVRGEGRGRYRCAHLGLEPEEGDEGRAEEDVGAGQEMVGVEESDEEHSDSDDDDPLFVPPSEIFPKSFIVPVKIFSPDKEGESGSSLPRRVREAVAGVGVVEAVLRW